MATIAKVAEVAGAGSSRRSFLPGFRGYITSTPKSVNFAKKTQKWAKNERDSCMPLPKNGERPYLAPPKTQFSDPFFDYFRGLLNPKPRPTPVFFHLINPIPNKPSPT